MDNLQNLPGDVQQALTDFVAAARQSWGDDLRSVVLYGSAAEGRLRATSDVNLILVLRRFDREHVDQVREPLRLAHAAVRLGVMFLLEEEVAEAVTAFAVKFDDIASRHRVLYGSDPFAALHVDRAAALARLRQVLLNLRLRLRERYALLSLREERLAMVVADLAGPLRACAATLLKLEGQTAENPKAALQRLVADLGDTRFADLLGTVSEAREQGQLEPGAAAQTVFLLLELVERVQARVARLL